MKASIVKRWPAPPSWLPGPLVVAGTADDALTVRTFGRAEIDTMK